MFAPIRQRSAFQRAGLGELPGIVPAGAVQVCMAQIGPCKIGAAQVSAAQIGVAQVGVLQVSAAQVCAAQIGAAQVGFAEISTNQIGTAQAGAGLYPGVCQNNVSLSGVQAYRYKGADQNPHDQIIDFRA